MKSNTGWTALYYSAKNGSHRLFTFVADMRTDIYVKDNLGQNCLHIVALFGHLNICKRLLDKHGFDVNIMSRASMRAARYDYAAKSGIYELLVFFFNLEIDIYLEDHSCHNCFHIAAAYKHFNLYKTLVEKHNFDVNIADNDGCSTSSFSKKW